MKIGRLGLAAALIAAPLGAQAAQAEDSAELVKKLQKRIDELEQKVKIIDRRRELDGEAAVEKAKTTPTVSLGANGFALQSADTNFVLKVRGYVQADARFFPASAGAGAANDTFLMRRVRPIFEGTVYEKYDYRLMLDFASGITSATGNNGFLQDGYINARFLPELQIQVGKFKAPVGLERLQSGRNLLFVERAFPTQLVPNRDVGVQAQGSLGDGVFNYAAGLFNGVSDGGSGDQETADNGKDLAGRIFMHPFKNSRREALRNLGVGVAGTFGSQQGALRTYVTPGQQRFFGYRTGTGAAGSPNTTAHGVHWRIVPQGYYYYGPLGIYGEYAVSSQELSRLEGATRTAGRVNNRAWQVAISYILTGEENSFNPLVPKHPLSLSNHGWGAWELLARVSQLSVDHAAFPLFADPATSASETTSWAVGLNWHLNKNVKLNLDYEQTDFAGGQNVSLTKQGEKVVLTRLQIAF